MEINTICVYCASSNKVAPIYGEVAYELGAKLAEEGITVVTGAGSIGLMRQVSFRSSWLNRDGTTPA